jgi:hypothetical protein
LVTTDGRFGAFTRAAGRPALRAELPEPDVPGDLASIAAAYGITLLGPPGMLPSQLADAAA